MKLFPLITWKRKETDPVQIEALQKALGISSVFATVLAGYGITTPNEARAFLEPSFHTLKNPMDFLDMEKAVVRLALAIEKQETVGVFGDYDADGITSTALLCDFLSKLGLKKIYPYTPNRFKEGYGLTKPGLEKLNHLGCTLVISVDCGITAFEAVDFANSKNMNMIILDHHTVLERLPEAYAIVNPHRPGCKGPHYICSAGVVFYVCMALRQHLRLKGYFKEDKEPNLIALLDLVGLATVADVMPLKDENRFFVHAGLKAIQNQKRAGLNALIKVSNLHQKEVTSHHLGFQIAPRLNASGRLEEASIAVDLLLALEGKKTEAIANYLDTQNQDRKAIEKNILEAAIHQIEQDEKLKQACVLLVGDPTWHPGVVGIVASRLVERYHKPAIVVGEKGKGSGRTFLHFHLHEALTSLKDHFIGFGGHAHAVGVHLELDKIDMIREALHQASKDSLQKIGKEKILEYEMVLKIEDINLSLIEELKQAEPHGRGNPKPLFVLEDVYIEAWKEVGQNHAKTVVNGIEIMAFGVFETIKSFTGPLKLLVSLEINTWNSQKRIQLLLKDLKQVI